MPEKKVNKLILFGGGRELFRFAINVLKSNIELVIFADGFHLQEKINRRGTLKDNFESKNMRYIRCDRLSPEVLKPYIDDRTFGVSVSAIWILKQEIISLFKGKLFNFHTTKLPRDRGCGGYTWKILAQDKSGGVTIHKLEDGIDTGDIVMQNGFVFPQRCRIPLDYYNYSEKKEDEIVLKFLKTIKEGKKFKLTFQDESASTYWPRINTKINGFIDWGWAFDQIELFINAFDDPYAGASTFLNGKRVYLKKCFKQADEGKYHPFQAGIVYRITCKGIFIAAVSGGLLIKNITDANGREITEVIKIGDRFYTPYSYLENAKIGRIFYNASGLKIKK